MNTDQAPLPTLTSITEPKPEKCAPAETTAATTTLYTPDFAILVCERIATTPQSLARLCAAPDMPSVATLFRWLRDHPEFEPLYVHAKQMQAEFLIDETLDIADDSSHDLMITEDGRCVPNTAALARCRIRIEHRRWIATKLLPRKYGSRAASSATSGFSSASSESTTQASSGGGFVLTEAIRMQMIELRRQELDARVAVAEAKSAAAAARSASDRPSPSSHPRNTDHDPYESLLKEIADEANGVVRVRPPEPERPVRRMYDCPDPQPVRVKSTMNKACS